eukprot:1667537-Prorocentrum_lima.AAC.1
MAIPFSHVSGWFASFLELLSCKSCCEDGSIGLGGSTLCSMLYHGLSISSDALYVIKSAML